MALGTLLPVTTATTHIEAAGLTTEAKRLREEGLMASTFEQDVRAFAAEFPTPNVQRAVALCETGTLRWEQVAEIFRVSLAKGLAEVA
jgi:hypothetical protein